MLFRRKDKFVLNFDGVMEIVYELAKHLDFYKVLSGKITLLKCTDPDKYIALIDDIEAHKLEDVADVITYFENPADLRR